MVGMDRSVETAQTQVTLKCWKIKNSDLLQVQLFIETLTLYTETFNQETSQFGLINRSKNILNNVSVGLMALDRNIETVISK